VVVEGGGYTVTKKGKHEAGRSSTRGGCTEERGRTGWRWCVNEKGARKDPREVTTSADTRQRPRMLVTRGGRGDVTGDDG
jgi:hypothetical protein